MMLFKKLATSSKIKYPNTNRFFKDINWSIVKEKDAVKELNQSVNIIVKELENTSSTDAKGPAPRFK